MRANVQASLREGRERLALLGLMVVTAQVSGADALVSNSVPCDSISTAEVLLSRYPDPEALIAPASCKEKARQLVQKWREQDLQDLPKLTAQACAEAATNRAEWLLNKEFVRLERQSVLMEMSCDCSTEILSQATNPPAPPPTLRIVTELTPRAENTTQNEALTPIRYSSQALAKKAALVISHNAAELLSIISGKIVKSPSAAQFDAEPGGKWNNQYKTALRGLVEATEKLQTLSIETNGRVIASGGGGSQTTVALPQIIQSLIEQTRLLSAAYDGIVRERQLPWGQCYESFAIRHQLIVNSVSPLTTKTSSNSKGNPD